MRYQAIVSSVVAIATLASAAPAPAPKAAPEAAPVAEPGHGKNYHHGWDCERYYWQDGHEYCHYNNKQYYWKDNRWCEGSHYYKRSAEPEAAPKAVAEPNPGRGGEYHKHHCDDYYYGGGHEYCHYGNKWHYWKNNQWCEGSYYHKRSAEPEPAPEAAPVAEPGHGRNYHHGWDCERYYWQDGHEYCHYNNKQYYWKDNRWCEGSHYYKRSAEPEALEKRGESYHGHEYHNYHPSYNYGNYWYEGGVKYWYEGGYKTWYEGSRKCYWKNNQKYYW